MQDSTFGNLPWEKPFYIIPLLVEQPTWGGSYIATFKNIRENEVTSRRIGQSYELSSQSFVSFMPATVPAYGFATATDLAHPQFVHRPNDIQPLQSLIEQAPRQILGVNVLRKQSKQNGGASMADAKMDVLIKFTQAQNNSYQVHVKPGSEFGKWHAKPESWYFLEKGKATLGLMPDVKTTYQKRCHEIDDEAQRLSQAVMSGKLSVADARLQLTTYINQNHPHNFVNTVWIERGQTVDLSAGGLHHSWETDDALPRGNVVYEVQLDVMDNESALRSFDQGSIKDDGKVRTISIDDYFQALDVEPAHNNPAAVLQRPPVTFDQDAQVTKLFDNNYYQTTQIAFNGRYGGLQTENQGSFHHLFVQEGRVEVTTDAGRWPLEKGWSLFVPAAVEGYQLNSEVESVVLRTRG